MKATNCRINFDVRLIYLHFKNKHANSEALFLFLFYFFLLNGRSTPFITNFIYTMVENPILFGLISNLYDGVEGNLIASFGKR